MILSTTIALALAVGSVQAAPYLKGFSIVEPRQLLESYDYVIIGGGNAGAVVSARLAELADANVLLIEAGPLDQGEDSIRIPRNAGGAMGSRYDWNYTTVAQTTINNRQIGIPSGKVVGGATVLNGMAFDRGSASDYDAWVDLGNPGWGWSDLLPYFKKSETFTPPPAAFAQEFNITWDMSVHGTDGPIYASYPRYLPPTHKNWFRGLAQLGIYLERDGHSGRALNAFWCPNALHPTEMVRSYARTGYYNPASQKGNFHVLLSQQATKLVGSGSPVRITAVEYASAQGQAVRRVNVNKEVILSGGVIGTPKLLQLSGIGNSQLLNRLNIPTLVDLPGVGTNYQDHAYIMTFNFLQNAPAAPNDAQARQQYEQSKTGPYTMSGPNAFVFLPLQKMSDRTSSIINTINSQSSTAHLKSGTHSSVAAGFAKQKEILSRRLATDVMAGAEFVFNGGSIMCSPQHPLSRGTVEITSSNAFQNPAIDPRYNANPVDNQIMADAIRWSRRAMATQPLQELRPMEFMPGAQQTSDQQLNTWVNQQISTMFHSCCTAPMQPRADGGVVDSNAKVYGTANLRVVDASIIPLIPATHLQATVYAMAEKVADLIKADHAA